jgi:endonuclease VIII
VPEGDTIFRTARTLRQVLGGQQLTAATTTLPRLSRLGFGRLVGQTVETVESRGKHLLVWFAPSGLALHTHMMLRGSWHTYRPGERWRKPERLARVVLATRSATAVCFSAPVVELLSRRQVERHPALAALGPDALDPELDLDAARRRLDAIPERAAGAALLDQRVLAGVGNVYRCEVLFLHGVDPWTPVGALAPATRDDLLTTAVRLLQANVAPQAGRRVTTGARPAAPSAAASPRHFVYGRARRPCLRCATPIRLARQGEQARLTYWCPRCQGPGPAGRP